MTSAHTLSDAALDRRPPLSAAFTDNLRDAFLSSSLALACPLHGLIQVLPTRNRVELARLVAWQVQLAELTTRLEHTRSLEPLTETAAAFSARPLTLHKMRRKFAPPFGLPLLARGGAWLGIALTVITFVALIALGITDMLPPLSAALGAVCSFSVFLMSIALELWTDTRLRHHADLHERCATLEAALDRVNTDLARLKCAVIAARQ